MKNYFLSLFQGYTDLHPTNTTLDELAERIRTDERLKDITENHRSYLKLNQTRAAGRVKAACPCFAVAVRFDGGKSKEHIGGW